VAGGVVIAGFWLSSVSWWFFLLVGAGALGPGILRETGWLRDKDEFQRRADHRAGYHAFLAVGLLAFVIEAFVRTAGQTIEHTHRLSTLFLALGWFTWLVSSLLAYWGPQRASAWILRIFGAVVLVFTIVSNLGAEWSGWAALLLHPLLAAPFFLMAWLSGRWPRVSGVALLAVSLFLLWFLGVPRASTDPGVGLILQTLISDGGTLILFLGPLLASGIALLCVGVDREEAEDEELTNTAPEPRAPSPRARQSSG
jgi:hypothetical protein